MPPAAKAFPADGKFFCVGVRIGGVDFNHDKAGRLGLGMQRLYGGSADGDAGRGRNCNDVFCFH
jgi:hypothetical protein